MIKTKAVANCVLTERTCNINAEKKLVALRFNLSRIFLEGKKKKHIKKVIETVNRNKCTSLKGILYENGTLQVKK